MHDFIVDCPYCGEVQEIGVDSAAGAQSFIEDCTVCCRPIEVRLRYWQDAWILEVARDDD